MHRNNCLVSMKMVTLGEREGWIGSQPTKGCWVDDKVLFLDLGGLGVLSYSELTKFMHFVCMWVTVFVSWYFIIKWGSQSLGSQIERLYFKVSVHAAASSAQGGLPGAFVFALPMNTLNHTSGKFCSLIPLPHQLHHLPVSFTFNLSTEIKN